MKKLFLTSTMLVCFLLLTGCTHREPTMPDPSNPSVNQDGASADYPVFIEDIRLIVKGHILDENSQPVEGIRVDLYGVREEDEPDVLSYNYTFSDSIGLFIMTRYVGRPKDRVLTIVASDPKNRYKEQVEYSEFRLSTIKFTNLSGGTQYIWNVTCDFVLSPAD